MKMVGKKVSLVIGMILLGWLGSVWATDLKIAYVDIQRWGEDTQNEMNQKRMEMERSISTALVKVIQKLGADEGYTLILEKNENIVLFVSKTIDITDRAIKAYDAQKK